ncbi:MAG: glycosyltransferase family 10 domain-containing protein [Luteolibacter sp.]
MPDAAPIWKNCEFIFDATSRDYDWLAVYDRFPSVSGERFSLWCEKLACPPENTVFITVEPSSIKSYEPAFLSQFGHVLTGHEPWSIQHPGVIRSQPALRWFYGNGGDHLKSLDEMISGKPMPKTLDISTVCSSKRQKHTLHRRRHDFTQKLKAAIPGLDVFGHGVRPMRDKAEALDSYRYHIAIENHRCDHHWTEKVSDAFLGWTLPFYYGCTNLKEYFPAESFIEIDIMDIDGAVSSIQQAISSREHENRLAAITEARNLVLTRYNLFAVLADIVDGEARPQSHHPECRVILSRHALRKSSVGNTLSSVARFLHRRWRMKSGRAKRS